MESSELMPAQGHEDCRLREFVRWPRVVLEHEYEHLSKVMVGASFLVPAEHDLVLHDLADISWTLQHHPRKIEV
jgi:hypothetical protein